VDRAPDQNASIVHANLQDKTQQNETGTHQKEYIDKNILLNSYKFPKPRHYVPNTTPDLVNDYLQNLLFISRNVGPKARNRKYLEIIDKLLTLSIPKKPKQKSEVILNLTQTKNNTLKMINFQIEEQQINSLMDTGSSHNLLSVKSFKKLTNQISTPIKMNMKVAGSILKNNIIAKTILPVTFTNNNEQITVVIPFLLAHHLNSYEAIIGAEFLMDDQFSMAITPTNLILTNQYNNFHIPLIDSKQKDLMQHYSNGRINTTTGFNWDYSNKQFA
jgi:hypothetical protein